MRAPSPRRRTALSRKLLGRPVPLEPLHPYRRRGSYAASLRRLDRRAGPRCAGRPSRLGTLRRPSLRRSSRLTVHVLRPSRFAIDHSDAPAATLLDISFRSARLTSRSRANCQHSSKGNVGRGVPDIHPILPVKSDPPLPSRIPDRQWMIRCRRVDGEYHPLTLPWRERNLVERHEPLRRFACC